MDYVKKISTLIVCIFCYSQIFSQVFGGDPASIKWKQINAPASRVIFPKGLDSVAQRITNVISGLNKNSAASPGYLSKKINIILQNQTTVSNGYVALGPFRSEFYLTADQNSFDMGSIPWPDQLALHEFRHVQQYNNFNVGLSKAMHVIFGDEGQALANNAAIPNWFYEGDAVYNETKESEQGRGRLPAYYNPFRSLWKAGKQYSWMKLRNGSYKDYVPDHYALGFLLVSYGREKYGDEFWQNVTHDAASFKGLFYPFQRAIKKYSGVSYTTFRKNGLDYFKQQFKDTAVTLHSAFRNDQYPSFANDDSVIYVSASYTSIPWFAIKTKTGEKKIRIANYTTDPYFSYGNSKIVYTSFRPDIRWGYRDYSELQVINIDNGKAQTLSRKTKYFSPDISPDGKRIIVVNQSPDGNSNLLLLDANNGSVLQKLPNPENLFYTYPKFLDEKNIIAAVRNPAGKMSLLQLDLSNNTSNVLLPFSYQVIGFPAICNDTIYFSSSFKKNDELFAFTPKDQKLWLIETGKQEGVGKYHITINNSQISWSTFTAEGYRLQFAQKNDLHYSAISPDTFAKATSDFNISELEQDQKEYLFHVSDSMYPVRPYHKSFQLIHFHSLEPAVDDPQYSLTLVGENILNTLQTNLSFTYDRSEKFTEFSLDATYGGWFPFLTAGANYYIDRSILFHQKLARYNQFEPYAGFNIPLNFSKGRAFTYLNFGSQYVYSYGQFNGKYRDSIQSNTYSYSSSFLSFSNQNQKAVQQIFPHFAQSFLITYKFPFGNLNGYQAMENASIYFPGFYKTHSLVLNGALLQKDSLNSINFSSSFPFSRGYQSVNFYRMYKWGVNYHLPLALPDVGFGNIAYLLRIRGNLFFDDTEVNDFQRNRQPYSLQFRSAGTEINFDTKWWNSVNVSFGFRYSRLLDKDMYGGNGRNRWEIILPVNLLNN